ncbi:uncharacterized protein LOC141851924 isoform X2 [Brevipalpus obovatus]|uniref:uncharacterized protein LOC141851924 isoform X2 n=1 Tax=Brevipalpus obovatus TaxID=246614 RepID=UPI003D9E4ABB
MTATTIGFQPHQHELNNYTTTHLIVSSASSPVEVINTGYLQLPKSASNNTSINVSHNHHENHHYISSNGNTTTSMTTITPANRPVNVKKPVQNFGSNQQGGGQNGHKMLTSGDLLRCKRRNGHVRNVALSGTPGQPPAVVRRNERERNRVKMVNMGFHTLRQHIPNGSKSKKMSKVETLRAAVEHIRQLQAVLNGDTSGYTPYQPCAVMPSDLKKPKLEDDQNFVPMHSPTDSISPSSISSYESSHYHHIQSPPPTLHLTSQQLEQLHHLTSQCTNYDSQASPISPTSPSKSSIASDISPPPYDNHVHYHHHHHQSQHLPMDGLDKACHPEESDIFDFASLLS